MKRSVLFILLPAMVMSAKAPPRKRETSIAVGGYTHALSNEYGWWRGLVLEGSLKDSNNGASEGAWIGSLTTFDRKEGKGAVLSAGKYLELGWGYAYLGLAGGKGADYLPKFQANGDLSVSVGQTGLMLGGGLLRTWVRDGHRDMLFQAGPTYYAKNCTYSYRYRHNQSDPNSHIGISHLMEFRHGLAEKEAWQSVSFSWGEEAYETLTEIPQDVRLKGHTFALKLYQPLGTRQGIKVTIEHGKKQDAYRCWGAQMSWVAHF